MRLQTSCKKRRTCGHQISTCQDGAYFNEMYLGSEASEDGHGSAGGLLQEGAGLVLQLGEGVEQVGDVLGGELGQLLLGFDCNRLQQLLPWSVAQRRVRPGNVGLRACAMSVNIH